MATITHLVTTPDSGNTPNTSGAFAPTVGNLLIVFVTKEASVAMASGDLTSSIAGFTFTLIRTQLYRSGADIFGVFVSDAKVASGASQTVTIAAGTDAAAGTIISVYQVSGMTLVGAAAIRGDGGTSNQAAGAPAPGASLPQAALTGNCCLSAVANATNPAGITNAPSSWTKSQDTGYTTGAVTGIATAFRNSGETGTTITWGTNSASISATIVIELDTSDPLAGHPASRRFGASRQSTPPVPFGRKGSLVFAPPPSLKAA